ncbi:MAG TPA: hypothetical protein VG498_06690 [Terriglobales bacterium]|nr:hypothetical protein [Terriglobales bacterium]
MIKAVIPLFFMLAANAGSASSSDSSIVGTWEGESKCTLPGSPCHDEHAVYEVKLRDGKPIIDGYKIVNGEKQYMGAMECGSIKDGRMSCTAARSNKTRMDEWVFEVNHNLMDGTLYIDKERTVYRKIHVEKK